MAANRRPDKATKHEAKELAEELVALQERRQDRSRAAASDGQDRGTYHVLKIVQPALKVEQ